MGTRYFLIFITFCFLQLPLQAQFLKKLKNRVERAAEETVLNKADKKTRKETGKVLDTIIDGENGPKGNNGGSADVPGIGKTESGDGIGVSNGDETAFSAYSKFDFEAGETILAYEDFSDDAIGDLPARWNSSSSAEVVALSTASGKWVRFSQGKGSFVPEFIKEFPENFTVEYDVIFDFDLKTYAYTRDFFVVFSDLVNPAHDMGDHTPGKNGAYFVIKGGISHDGSLEFQKYASDSKLNISSKKEVPLLLANGNGRGQVMHVSIWRQGQRLRVYFNGEKAFDIPRAFEDAGAIRNMRFFSQLSEGDSYFYLGNIRYAVGKADMRSKLVTEGKLVTYGITFDKGKTDVKAESFGVLKSISEVLKENPTMKVKIIGHTDADGDPQSNMELSRARAAAVSRSLVANFGVSAPQLVTEGKGESQLLRQEATPDADALNRRVEFIKQ